MHWSTPAEHVERGLVAGPLGACLNWHVWRAASCLQSQEPAVKDDRRSGAGSFSDGIFCAQRRQAQRPEQKEQNGLLPFDAHTAQKQFAILSMS